LADGYADNQFYSEIPKTPPIQSSKKTGLDSSILHNYSTVTPPRNYKSIIHTTPKKQNPAKLADGYADNQFYREIPKTPPIQSR
jgi:hypothetical protein